MPDFARAILRSPKIGVPTKSVAIPKASPETLHISTEMIRDFDFI